MAHEAVRVDSWKRTDEMIPVTRRGQCLSAYDTTDTKHARLVKPTKPASSTRSPRTDNLTVHGLPNNMTSTTTDDNNTLNMSLPVLNFSDLSLPNAILSQINHHSARLCDTGSANTDRSDADLSDQEFNDQNPTDANH